MSKAAVAEVEEEIKRPQRSGHVRVFVVLEARKPTSQLCAAGSRGEQHLAGSKEEEAGEGTVGKCYYRAGLSDTHGD